MAIKVVQGFVGKPDGTTQPPTRSGVDSATTTSSTNLQNIASTSVTSAARLVSSSEAVISTVRATRSSSSSKRVKDENEASEFSKDISKKIREDVDISLSSHEGLSSAKSAPVLL